MGDQATRSDAAGRRREDGALRASEARYRQLLDSVTDYVYTVEIENGKPVRTTHGAACVAVTGYSAEQYEADPMLWYRMIVDADKSAVLHQAELVLAGQRSEPVEHRLIHADGSIRWVRNTAVPRFDAEGRLIAYDGLVSDITERRVAEEALRESEATYRTLFEASADGILVETLDGRVIDCNSAACAMYGYGRDELIGRAVADLQPAEVSEGLASFAATFAECGALDLEIENVTKRGERFPCEVSLQLVTVGGERRVLAYVRNIADRKQREAEIRRLYAELEQHVAELQAANVELESFSYSVSHDLRTPLVLIEGFARLLQAEWSPSLGESGVSHLHRICENAERMRRLIDDLLAFSRVSFGPLQRTHVDTTELVRQTLDDLWGEHTGRHVDVIVDRLPPCEADPELLKLVFSNLLSNAFKFTRRCEHARIEVGHLEKRGKIVFFVRDNGVGFDMDHAREVFTVFRRLHCVADFEGTGVGLANVERIIRRHNGRIWVEAAVGSGACFFFTLC